MRANALVQILAFALFIGLGTSVSSLSTGSLAVSVSVTSVNNIVGLLAGILPSYLVNNKTLDVNYTDSGLGYNFFIKEVHITTFNINKREVKYLPNSNGTMRLFFSGIDLDSDVEGTLTIIGIIPLHAAKLKIKNLTLQMDL